MYIDKMLDLKLDKITGLRADKVTKQIVPFKKSTKQKENLGVQKKSANTKNGMKY